MLTVDGQDVYHRACLLLYNAAAEVDGVVAELTRDMRVRPLQPYVFQFEQRQVERCDGAAHLNGRVARLGIDAADVRNGDNEVNVTHDLGKDEVGDVVYRQFLKRLSVEEIHPFECWCLNIGRREPVGKRIYACDDVRLVVNPL